MKGMFTVHRSTHSYTHLLGIGDLEYDRLRLLIGERE